MAIAQDTSAFAPLSTHNVTLPDHLIVRFIDSDLFSEYRPFGYNGTQFFGVAFVQGKRLQFTTAMSVDTMLGVSKLDRAAAGSGVDEVQGKVNRPRVAGHAKALKEYFLATACSDEKFILPAFAFNFGDESNAENNEATVDAVLTVFADPKDATSNHWPALFQLPGQLKLDTTDGAHRSGEMRQILNDNTRADHEKQLLARNACDVKIIFERRRIDAHQDFADCAKAKPITASLITTFDVRDARNNAAVELVKKVPFLQFYVDSTASNVNLSAKSAKVWSMSAVRGFIGHIQDRYPPPLGAVEGEVEVALLTKLQGSEEMFTSLIKYMPQLHALDLARQDARKDNKKHTDTPAMYRSKRGGDIALRGIGMSLFARAFVYAKQHNVAFDVVAKRLAMVDWHLLDCEKEDLPTTETPEGRLLFPDAVKRHLVATWSSLLVIGENRYRIGSSNDEANRAWERITEGWPEVLAKQAAATQQAAE